MVDVEKHKCVAVQKNSLTLENKTITKDEKKKKIFLTFFFGLFVLSFTIFLVRLSNHKKKYYRKSTANHGSSVALAKLSYYLNTFL